MRLIRFTREVGRVVDDWDSRGVWVTNVADSGGETRVSVLHFAPGSTLGTHPTGVDQAFLVLAGDGWVAGPDGEAHHLTAGQGVIWDTGEDHTSGSEQGMVAAVVQAEHLDALVSDWDPERESYEDVRAVADAARPRPVALGLVWRDDALLVFEDVDTVTGKGFVRPPGGGIRFREHSVDAVRREMAEEVGCAFDDPVLVGVLENVFALRGTPRHELLFVYEGRLADVSLYGCEELTIHEGHGGKLTARWIALDELREDGLLEPDGLLALLDARHA